MNQREAKAHPMYNTLYAQLGEKAAIAAIIAQDGEKQKENQSDVSVSEGARKIVIPATMSKMDAAVELKRQYEDEENVITIARKFDGWDWKEVLVATKRAAEEYFGWIQGVNRKGFFGSTPPTDIDITVDIKNGEAITETCFYGDFAVSIWEDAVVAVNPGSISCNIKKRYSSQVREFFDLIETKLRTESIYRSRSIVVNYKDTPFGKQLDFDIIETHPAPHIMLNSDAQVVLDNFIVDDLGQEGKRCYLFSGGYGNGKTETAMAIGKTANDKGMSFFYIKDATAFEEVLSRSVNYQPAVIFMEDVDEIAAGEQRDADMNKILNTLDGVQTKGKDLTVIFTTNHENRINKALRRPGRIDIVVNFGNPELETRERILRYFFEKHDEDNALDYPMLTKKIGDVPGAVIAEMAKRATKLFEKRKECSNEQVLAAIVSLKHHIDLMNEAPETSETTKVIFAMEGKVRQVSDEELVEETFEAVEA